MGKIITTMKTNNENYKCNVLQFPQIFESMYACRMDDFFPTTSFETKDAYNNAMVTKYIEVENNNKIDLPRLLPSLKTFYFHLNRKIILLNIA